MTEPLRIPKEERIVTETRDPPNLDARLRELAGRYYDQLEDQLYDPRPEVDGYDKAHQRQHVTGLLRDLARDAANLILDPEGYPQDHFALVELGEDDEALCPQCNTPLTATISTRADVAPRWQPEARDWAHAVEAKDLVLFFQRFACPGCGWSAAYVEPAEDEGP